MPRGTGEGDLCHTRRCDVDLPWHCRSVPSCSIECVSVAGELTDEICLERHLFPTGRGEKSISSRTQGVNAAVHPTSVCTLPPHCWCSKKDVHTREQNAAHTAALALPLANEQPVHLPHMHVIRTLCHYFNILFLIINTHLLNTSLILVLKDPPVTIICI